MEDNTILIGKKDKPFHKGMLQGIIANGGQFQVGNIVIEVVAQKGDFRHIQIYMQGLNSNPVKQTWVRTKKEKEIVIKEVVKKPVQKKLTTTMTDEVIEL